MFDPQSVTYRYPNWTPEPTLKDSFNHDTCGSFLSFGDDNSTLLV